MSTFIRKIKEKLNYLYKLYENYCEVKNDNSNNRAYRCR